MTAECTTTVDRQCTVNTCSCPNGTPTVSGGSVGTLCEVDGSVDCSACSAGYTVSEIATNGLQTCVFKTCVATEVANSNKEDLNSIAGTSKNYITKLFLCNCFNCFIFLTCYSFFLF